MVVTTEGNVALTYASAHLSTLVRILMLSNADFVLIRTVVQIPGSYVVKCFDLIRQVWDDSAVCTGRQHQKTSLSSLFVLGQ